MNFTHDDVASRRCASVRRVLMAALIAGLPLPALAGTTGEGIASFYGRSEHGGRTASGERFDMHAMTAAHRTAPLGSRLRVTNLRNGSSVVVRVNDRGPFVRGRIIDLSQAAASSLGFIGAGLTRVRIETAEADAPTGHAAPASEPETTGSVPPADKGERAKRTKRASKNAPTEPAQKTAALTDVERLLIARN